MSAKRHSEIEILHILKHIKFPDGSSLDTGSNNPMDVGNFRLYEDGGTLYFMVKTMGKNLTFKPAFRNYDVLFTMTKNQNFQTVPNRNL